METKIKKGKIIVDCDKCGLHLEMENLDADFKGFEAKVLSKCYICNNKTKVKFEEFK